MQNICIEDSQNINEQNSKNDQEDNKMILNVDENGNVVTGDDGEPIQELLDVANELEETKETQEPEGKGKDKHANFVRLSVPRVDKVVMALQNLSKLSNRSSYSYSEDEVAQIFAYIDEALDSTKSSFLGKTVKKSGFSFKN